MLIQQEHTKQFEVESLILEQSTKIKDGPLEFPPFFLVGVTVTRMVPIAMYLCFQSLVSSIYAATAITPIVTALFNLSIKTCTFPRCWKISNISPIPKGSDISNPSNYCPVSLLSILSKVFERHIFSLISDSVAISENQWGFQTGKSTSSVVLSALYSWEALLDKGQEVLVTFLDIKKLLMQSLIPGLSPSCTTFTCLSGLLL